MQFETLNSQAIYKFVTKNR